MTPVTAEGYSFVVGQPARRGDDGGAPGKGSEPAQAYKARFEECMKEPGCEQFEVFQIVLNPDKLALLERWTDQAVLDIHAKLNSTRPALRPELRMGSSEREDYHYNRTR